ncbi:TetR/AcrR family transcriptional regulator [Algirhabdus cladophorae]|uniref:TetR/AcrR family transcriptional regulator n=1 Tax=Algirhabdus cladophorae TaxID=3377108 RepID=UPI003B846943
MNAPTPDIRKGRKFDQVLEGAREVFMADGFEGASVDDIAKAAGVSKATLYSYFPDKRLLFMEVAKTECNRQTELAVHDIDDSQPPRIVLTRAATNLMHFFMSDFGQQVFRISVAESARFPELGREFFECGPMTVHRILAEYIQIAIDRGELAVDDIDLAAWQFPELCKTDLFPKLMFGVQKTFTEADLDRIVKGAVDMFMARYGT